MSGTDLASTKGMMKGHFYMANVPHGSHSGKAGDHVDGLNATEKFEVEVAPFPLEVGYVKTPKIG